MHPGRKKISPTQISQTFISLWLVRRESLLLWLVRSVRMKDHALLLPDSSRQRANMNTCSFYCSAEATFIKIIRYLWYIDSFFIYYLSLTIGKSWEEMHKGSCFHLAWMHVHPLFIEGVPVDVNKHESVSDCSSFFCACIGGFGFCETRWCPAF